MVKGERGGVFVLGFFLFPFLFLKQKVLCLVNRGLFLEVRTSMSYISPSSTSEGSTRRFDLTTRVQTQSHNQQLCSLSCCLFFVTTLRATAVSLSTGYFALLLKLQILRLDILRLDASACDWIHSNSWFIEALDWMSCCLRLDVQLVRSNACDCILRLDFLLYDVASLLRLDVQATCWYLATAGLKPSADYDDVTDDVINAKPSADRICQNRSINLSLFDLHKTLNKRCMF
ncbi:hypothetical protein F511_23778 [Dorcoceras hygrometricum]|uniref:Uncharacterized protein n=1 Tax=Dorcoceras hygrometricum TaxID=472368 RepID=A0A2Z7CUK8_9LAMI|nr:hypothetical protein F511_23778 [Dorcoceras hygrometricum]